MRSSGVHGIGRACAVGAVCASLLFLPVGAGAAVTVGSTLPPVSGSPLCSVPTTQTNTVVAGGVAQVPFDGFVFRWRINVWTSGGSHLYELRILRPAGGGTYTGAGTGPPQQVPNAGVNVLTLPTPMPVKTGGLIGFDCEALAPLGDAVPVPGSTYAFFSGPPLADNSMPSRAPTNTVSNRESLVNADVAVKPSNTFTFGVVGRNKRKGTATLGVIVPGPGTLALGGQGVKAQQAAGAVGSKSVKAAGTVNLLVKATGKAKGKLSRTGKATVAPSVTYTPFTDISGDPNTQSTKVKLIKKR